jgi:hypothetical protein
MKYLINSKILPIILFRVCTLRGGVPLTFSFAQLAKGKSLGRIVNPQLIPMHKHSQHTVWNILLYPSLTELPSIEIN